MGLIAVDFIPGMQADRFGQRRDLKDLINLIRFGRLGVRGILTSLRSQRHIHGNYYCQY